MHSLLLLHALSSRHQAQPKRARTSWPLLLLPQLHALLRAATSAAFQVSTFQSSEDTVAEAAPLPMRHAAERAHAAAAVRLEASQLLSGRRSAWERLVM